MYYDLERVTEELGDYSNRVSNGVRASAFAILAATWVIFTVDNVVLPSQGVLGLDTTLLLRTTFIASVFTLGLDLFQYFFAYLAHDRLFEFLETKERQNQKRKLQQDLDAALADEENGEGNAEKLIEDEFSRESVGLFGMFCYRTSFILYFGKFLSLGIGAVAFAFIAFGLESAYTAAGPD